MRGWRGRIGRERQGDKDLVKWTDRRHHNGRNRKRAALIGANWRCANDWIAACTIVYTFDDSTVHTTQSLPPLPPFAHSPFTPPPPPLLCQTAR